MTCCAPVILVLRYLENTRRGICLSNNIQKLLTNDAREWSSQEDQSRDAGGECERSHWCRYFLDARGCTRLDKYRRRVRRTLGRWLEYSHHTGRRTAIRRGVWPSDSVTSRCAMASRVADGSAASCGATDASLLVMRRSANVDAESRNSTEEPRGPSFFPPALAPFAFGRVDIEDEGLKSPDRTNPPRVALGAYQITAIGQKPVPRGQRDIGVLTRTPVIVASKPVRASSERAILRTRACTCRRGARPGSRVITHRVQLIQGWQEPVT